MVTDEHRHNAERGIEMENTTITCEACTDTGEIDGTWCPWCDTGLHRWVVCDHGDAEVTAVDVDEDGRIAAWGHCRFCNQQTYRRNPNDHWETQE